VCCHITFWNINVRKQAINDILEGSVATYLSYGEVINSQIKKGLLLNLVVIFLKIGECLAKLQAIRWFSCISAPGYHTAKSRRKCRTQSTFLPVTMPNIHRFWKLFHWQTNNKLFLIYLLAIQPHLKYVTIVPYNLLLFTALVCDVAHFLTLMFHKVM